MAKLHVYHCECDWVIAKSPEDALAVLDEQIGEHYDLKPDDVIQEPDDKELSIWTDNSPTPDSCKCLAKIKDREEEREKQLQVIDKMPDSPGKFALYGGVPKPLNTHPNGHLVDCPLGRDVLTCAQWVAKEGRCFLASTEY